MRVLFPSGITTQDFLVHLLNDGGLSFGEAGPDPFVFRFRKRRLRRRFDSGGKEAVDDLLRSPHMRDLGEDGGYGGHLFLVRLGGLGQTHRGRDGFRLDHGNAFTVHRDHQ